MSSQASCRVPNQTSGKMLIPLLLTVLHISLPFAGAEQPGQNATAHTTVGWVSDGDNKRSTISLLYNCSFTIFLCTWSAMHLNVPGEKESQLQTFGRKCKWMLTGVLAPEYVALLAINEWHAAWKLVTQEPHLPTITHGFFAVMGGYAINVMGNAEGDASKCFRLDPRDFSKLAKLNSLNLPSKMELMDRSKGDWISKSITSIQVIWFVSQLVGRAIQRLPVTTLELFTCAIVVCTVATYIAWWHKPLDVQRPVVLDSEVSATFLTEHRIRCLEAYQSFIDSEGASNYSEMETLSFIAYCLLIFFAFVACHLIGWNFSFPTWSEQLLWRVASVMCAGMPIFMLFLLLLPGELGDMVGLLSVGAYVLIRTYLFVEAFVGLRSVPADVYRTVNWAAYIPHI